MTAPRLDSVGPVLQVVASTDPRGAELFGVQLGKAFAERGATVETVALAPGHTGDASLELRTLGPSRRSPGTFRHLREAARGRTVVIAHGSTTLPLCALALVGTGVPVVYRSVGDPTFWLNSRGRRLRTRWFLSRMAAVVSLTEESGRSLIEATRLPADRLRAIPKGVPADSFPPPTAQQRREARERFSADSDRDVVLDVGALSPEKNVAQLIRAVAPLDVDLVIVGDGPDRAEIEEMASRAGGQVRLVGRLADPLPAYHAADVVAVASHTEGLPGVLIEAGLCGLPAVTTDVGFVRAIIEHEVSGIVVPAGDVDALRLGISEALAARARLGQAAARLTRDRFSMERVADRWAEVIVDVAGKPRD